LTFFSGKPENTGQIFIATGHYAKIIKNSKTGMGEIHKGFDRNKDQSYVLWQLKPWQVACIIMPLGGLKKKI